MPTPIIDAIAFVSPGTHRDADPSRGLERTLDLFAYGESLGFAGAWIRPRHLERGVSSASTFLAAASQRTDRIELGASVIPLGLESPFRLAEDLATADVLSHGRVQIGVSAGVPPHADLIGDLVFDAGWRANDVSIARVERLVTHLQSGYLGDEDTVIEVQGSATRPRLQPRSPGIADRVWYGARAADAAAAAGSRGLHLLTGTVVEGRGATSFDSAQRAIIGIWRVAGRSRPARRVSVGRVVIPTDSATASTRERYRDYVRERDARTLVPHGPDGTWYAPDVVGPSDEILERLLADPILGQVHELRLELPAEFGEADHRQILDDFVSSIAPGLGWRAPTDALVP